MKTLLVEDNQADARLIRELLKESAAWTFEVQHVTRLDMALERLREEAFDVLLLDLGLPDTQGMETLTVAHKACGGLPIVVLTGLDDERLALEVMRAGAQDYLVKGRFDTQLLVRTIRYAVQRKQAEEEVRRLNAELEMRVAERTLQFQAANEELQKELAERKQAEEALRESQAKLTAALASMTDAVFIADAEGRLVEINDAFLSYHRFNSREEFGKSIADRLDYLEAFMANGEPAPLEMWAMPRALRGETVTSTEYTLRRKDTGETWVGSYSFSPIRDKYGVIVGAVVTARDITAAKRVEEERQISIDFLAMVNQSRGTKDLLQAATAFLQQRSGCEAVGIRLREGEDFPYFETRGFPQQFVISENSLCARDVSGEIIRDDQGNPVIECMCGNVICGRFEPSKPFFTTHGSFWSNGTTELLARTTQADRQSRTRNRCNGDGYESVALIPMRDGEERFGLLQLNDRRKGRFTAENIAMWERLAGHLAAALSKFQSEEALRKSQAKLTAAMSSMTDSAIITDAEGHFIDFNDAFATFYRFKSKAECPRSFDEFTALVDVKMADGRPAPREMYAVQRALRGETATGVEYALRRKDTGETWIGSLSFGPIRDEKGAIVGSVVTSREITEAKRVEEERQIAVDFLAMVNRSLGTRDLLQRAAAFFRQRSGCEAVGIRMREGEDYPYFEARGFTDEFVQLESRLCTRAASGEVVKDAAGNSVLECLCGSVIRGCAEISRPFYTTHGSFWSNSTTELNAAAGEGDLPATTRNRCNREGYESVALFPINAGEERLGLLQLVDRRKGRFSAQNIALWEQLAGHLATAVSKFQAEEALQRSEEQFRELAEGIPQLAWMTNPDGWIYWYNRRWYEYTGTTPEQMEGWGWQSVHDANELPGILVRWKAALASGQPWEDTFPLRGADGVFRPFLSRAFPLRDAEGRITHWFGTNTDVRDLKHAEAELKKVNRTLEAMKNSSDAILRATDEESFLKEVCHSIARDCNHAMVWIGIAEKHEGKNVKPVAYSGLDEGYLETLRVTWDSSAQGLGPTGTAIRTGQPSMCRNMLTDPAFAPWREEAIKRGYASSLVIPLKERGETWGAITIYSREPDAFTQSEVDLLMDLARDLEFGIQALRMRAARTQAEEALRESEERLSLFVEYAPAALAMFDKQMRYLRVSRRWRADYGLGDRDLSGISYYDVFPEISDEWKEAHRRGLAGEALRHEAESFERPDGTMQWIRWEILPWRDATGMVGGILILTEDLTKHIQAQEAQLRSEKAVLQGEQLRALAEQLRQVREEERKRVARDLHDDLGQLLTAIKMDLTWTTRHLTEPDGEVQNRLMRAIEMVGNGAKTVRNICNNLRPGILDDLGLPAAIEWQANEFASRTGIDCEVILQSSDLHADSGKSITIFRIFQECLTNVMRHAEAKSVRVSLRGEDGDLVLIVQDDGVGFLESDVSRTMGSLGLLGMKERAQACGGEVVITSSPGNGTTVTIRVPVEATSAERQEK